MKKYGYSIDYQDGTWAPFDSREEAREAANQFYREMADKYGWDEQTEDFDHMVYEVEDDENMGEK